MKNESVFLWFYNNSKDRIIGAIYYKSIN